MDNSGLKKQLCSVCGKEIRSRILFTRKREAACRFCFEKEKAYSTAVVRITPDGYSYLLFSGNFNFFESNSSAYPPPVLKESCSNENLYKINGAVREWEYTEGYIKIQRGSFASISPPVESDWAIGNYLSFLERFSLHSELEVFWVFGRVQGSRFISTEIVSRKEYEEESYSWFRKYKLGIQYKLSSMIS